MTATICVLSIAFPAHESLLLWLILTTSSSSEHRHLCLGQAVTMVMCGSMQQRLAAPWCLWLPTKT